MRSVPFGRLAGMVEAQWRASIVGVSSLWYSAWVDAGEPDLTGVFEPAVARPWWRRWRERLGWGARIGAALRYLEPMRRIVLLNPYAAGSHAQWARGMVRACPLAAQRAGEEAQFELYELPGRHWKWRMVSGALALVDRMNKTGAFDRDIDRFIVTDMMDVGQFRSALPPRFRTVPIILYFHENQLTFPAHQEGPNLDWDRHYAFLNVTSALLADRIWFNSEYHRSAFLSALPDFMSAFPAPRPRDAVERIASNSEVMPIGIDDDVMALGASPELRPRIYRRWPSHSGVEPPLGI